MLFDAFLQDVFADQVFRRKNGAETFTDVCPCCGACAVCGACSLFAQGERRRGVFRLLYRDVNGAFANARFTEIYIPAGVTEIRNYAFGTDSCGQIVFAGSEEEWNAIDKQPYWNLGNGEVQILFEGENDL